MKVNFVTSGFPNGFTEMFLAELRRYLPAQGFFVMVASDFRRMKNRSSICSNISGIFLCMEFLFKKQRW